MYGIHFSDIFSHFYAIHFKYCQWYRLDTIIFEIMSNIFNPLTTNAPFKPGRVSNETANKSHDYIPAYIVKKI